MSNELVAMTPEGVEVANAYITLGNIDGVSQLLGISREKVTDLLDSRAVRKYIDQVYLDTGYRNRNNIASLLDEMIMSKVEEAQESGIYTSKDLMDLLQFAHKVRMDELKLQEQRSTTIRNQTNVQINDGGAFGDGNYGRLVESLLKHQT